MLILTRRIKETIMVGDDIEITLVAVEGDKVRLAIKAPQDVPIHRKEIYEAIQEENRQAAQSASLGVGGIKQLLEKGPEEKGEGD